MNKFTLKLSFLVTVGDFSSTRVEERLPWCFTDDDGEGRVRPISEGGALFFYDEI